MSRRKRERKGPSATPPTRERERIDPSVDAVPLTRATAIWGGIGLAIVVAGFALLAQGSIALAPTLLVIGFLVFFPMALVK